MKPIIPITMSDVPYGDHQRNVLDLWLVESEEPTPLVIYIHGGGFIGGDKSKIYGSPDIPRFLDAGVSFAAINYRYRNQDTKGILACLLDAKRALQFIRSNADKWNIDKKCIDSYGGSAGAGTSLWLGFHNEMADPDNPDPVFRESTRLSVVGALAIQATYDLTKWPDILGIKIGDKAKEEILEAMGLISQELESENKIRRRRELDMLGWMSQDDPPMYVRNNMEGGIPNLDDRAHINHHPWHALALKRGAEEVGIEAVVFAPKIGSVSEKEISLVDFFLLNLSVKPE